MNSRPLIILAAIILAVVGAALWFLQSNPAPPPLPEAMTATPAKIDKTSQTEPVVPKTTKLPQVAKSEPKATPKPPAPLAEWEVKIDEILRANPDNSEAANRATAQMLINMLPTLPVEGQSEAAQHITNLLDDKEYGRVLSIVKNPQMPEEVLDVFVTDLMNRDDSVKLPTLLEIAKIPNHPHHEEAATDLQIFLDEDYGTDWAKWDTAMKAYLKKQAAENAEAEAPVVGK